MNTYETASRDAFLSPSLIFQSLERRLLQIPDVFHEAGFCEGRGA
jgi:hypothetical protein